MARQSRLFPSAAGFAAAALSLALGTLAPSAQGPSRSRVQGPAASPSEPEGQVSVPAQVPAAAPDDRFAVLARQALSQIDGELRLPGLSAPVEVIRDRWGVPHIYARSTTDLFMAQGYVVAQDRLWQMEMWRRQREGRMAEILGPQAVERDRIARLLKYRGPMDDREWTAYHPDGRRIFDAFAAGVNAFIDARAANLPVEFVITGIRPTRWTAETLVLRSASFGNAGSELQLARNVARLGVEEANRRVSPDPWDDLVVPDGLDVAAIDDDVVAAGRGGRGGGQPALIAPYDTWPGAAGEGRGRGRGRGRGGENVGDAIGALDAVAVVDPAALAAAIPDPPGSNNWVVSAARSATAKPVVVNDPHREVSNPSLRYVVHLNAPGWNVIGAVEAPFVGVAIGHNDRVGWGLTIVGTDQEDVYVETVNPANPGEVRWRDGWEPIRVVHEEIVVKGEAPRRIELKFTRHGPVFHEDRERRLVYALRSALLEPGTAPYLAGLRLSQSTDCRQFLDAAMFWAAPSENLICGDVDGNISWQASALTPNRGGAPLATVPGRGPGAGSAPVAGAGAPSGTPPPGALAWSGRLPVPGDGRHEWRGFRADLPREINPPRGYIATANDNIQPKDFAPPIMFKSAANVPFDRITRLRELFDRPRALTLDDHRAMQGDALHLRARSEIALFRGWSSADPAVERARAQLAGWDAVLARDSAPAAIYSAWRSASSADERDAARPLDARRPEHEASLGRAIATLTTQMGDDWSAWRWGRMHTRAFPHPLVAAFGLPAVERPGGSGTVAADGASYREILDVADWDRSLATNTPGQSAQPGSPFYGNLLPLWTDDVYFPLAFSRAKVDEVAAHRLVLRAR